MTTNTARGVSCPNESCRLQGTHLQSDVVPHGYSKVKWGRRRRYRCKVCGKTFGVMGTPNKRLQQWRGK